MLLILSKSIKYWYYSDISYAFGYFFLKLECKMHFMRIITLKNYANNVTMKMVKNMM